MEITDWEEWGDVLHYLRSFMPAHRIHRKIRRGVASGWLFYSRSTSLYTATIKYRDHTRSVQHIPPDEDLDIVVIRVIFAISQHYESIAT